MTTAEAKEMIKKEFIEAYYEWLKDEREMPNDDYGRKYGYLKGDNSPHKDNFESVKVFLDYFFSGRYIQGWVRAGYDRETIWALKNEGFLSYKFYGSYQARIRGKSDFYYINQKTARAIYKEAKTA